MNKKPMNPKTLLLLVLAIFSGTPFFSSAQEMKRGIEYTYDMKTFIRSKKMVWYGWDFSKSRMFDISKTNDAELIQKKYIPAMSERLNKRITPEKIRQETGKEVIVDLQSVQDLYQTINSKEFITLKTWELPVDSIKSLVRSYKLPQREGIGFVIIIELMYKASHTDKFVTGYVTFFDIATREILWTTKMKGQPGSMYGFTMYWIQGIRDLYDFFMEDYYDSAIKKAMTKMVH